MGSRFGGGILITTDRLLDTPYLPQLTAEGILLVQGLDDWIFTLEIMKGENSFLKVKDSKTGSLYLVKKVGESNDPPTQKL